ncbi:MAG: hypothetical protein ACPGYY_00810, partial [Bacteroidia bacterium]
LCFVGFHFLAGKWSLAPLAMLILGILHIQKLIRAENSSDYNAQLKLLSIGSLIVSIISTAHFAI